MGKSPAQEMKTKLTATKKVMAEERKKSKVKEDQAFGLKNQKGAQVKLNVDRLRSQAAMAGRTKAQVAADEKKKEEQREKSRLKKLGWTEEELITGKKVVATAGFKQLAAGVDPKSVLCGYFKAGKCKQGKKCKFSHDLDIERSLKSKRSLYTDEREREADTMDQWDQEKLEAVISQKRNNPNATQIVCNYFIEAIETRKYGWFWKCDNGDHCLYQHKLPPGFVLKSDMPVEEDMAEEDICEHIERERAKLDPAKCTQVTPENFAEWKEKQKKRKLEEMKKEMLEAKKSKGKSKQHSSGMSGRALFTFRPNLFVDDDEAAVDGDYEYETEVAEGEVLDDTKAKLWEAEEKVMDESEFLAALSLQEKSEDGGDGGDGGDSGDGGGDASAAAPAEEAKEEAAAGPSAEELEAIKKAKKVERQRKAEEKKKAKLAAKLAASAKPMTAFQKRQQEEKEEADKQKKKAEARAFAALG